MHVFKTCSWTFIKPYLISSFSSAPNNTQYAVVISTLLVSASSANVRLTVRKRDKFVGVKELGKLAKIEPFAWRGGGSIF